MNVLSTQPVTILGPVQVWASEEDSVGRRTGCEAHHKAFIVLMKSLGTPGIPGVVLVVEATSTVLRFPTLG